MTSNLSATIEQIQQFLAIPPSAADAAFNEMNHVLVGAECTVLGSVLTLLNWVTVAALLRDAEHMRLPIYRLISATCILNSVSVLFNGIVTGVTILLKGNVSLTFNIVMSFFSAIAWEISSFLDIVIAINRMVVFALPAYSWLFGIRYWWAWLTAAACGGLANAANFYGHGWLNFYYNNLLVNASLGGDESSLASFAVVTDMTHVISFLITMGVFIKVKLIRKKMSNQQGLSVNEMRALYQIVIFNSSQCLLDVVWFTASGRWSLIIGQTLTIFVPGELGLLLLIYRQHIRKSVKSILFCWKAKNAVAHAQVKATTMVIRSALLQYTTMLYDSCHTPLWDIAAERSRSERSTIVYSP